MALYFENSLLAPDLELLPAAAAAVTRVERMGPKIVVDSVAGVGVPWKGAAEVDGEPWPAVDGETVWLPAGPHSIEPAPALAGPRLIRLNADLKGARTAGPGGVEFSYRSSARAIAILDREPAGVEIDGTAEALRLAGPKSVLLPRGQHVVTIRTK